MAKYLKESEIDRMSQAYMQGADAAKAQMAEEIASLKSEIASMQKERDDAKHVCQHVGSMLLEVYKEQI